MGEEAVEAIQRLEPCVQNYAWGVMGSNSSLVSRMAGGTPDASKPYAELWMGTHPSAPSKVAGQGLSEFLKKNESFAGVTSQQEWSWQLPYLFKCLSVRCPLSIQAHPDKALAEVLHRRDPKNYKDDNHKPELACAVSEFEGLCGFRPLDEIAEHLGQVPELASLVGVNAAAAVVGAVGGADEAQSSALRAAYSNIMSQPEDKIAEEANRLVERLSAKLSGGVPLTTLEQLVISSNAEFHADVGLLSIYMLNHVVLQPGESIFLRPNLPHAYLKGDCMELMAASDNVVRAGFTPKFKDVETLVTMLEYKSGKPQVMRGESEGRSVCRYSPPGTDFPEFSLKRCQVSSADGGDAESLGKSACPRIAICTAGAGVLVSASALSQGGVVKVKAGEAVLNEGDVVVLSANVDVSVSGKDGGHGVVFVASCHPCYEASPP